MIRSNLRALQAAGLRNSTRRWLRKSKENRLMRAVFTAEALERRQLLTALTFAPPASISLNNHLQPFATVLADVNGDGKPDLVTANADGTIGVAINEGNGTFAPDMTTGDGLFPNQGLDNDLAVATVNGRTDIFVTYGESVAVLQTTPSGTAVPVANSPFSLAVLGATKPGTIQALAVGAVNGRETLVVGTINNDQSGSIVEDTLVSTGSGFQGFAVSSTSPLGPGAVGVIDVAIGAFADPSGDVAAVGVDGNIYVLPRGFGPGILSTGTGIMHAESIAAIGHTAGSDNLLVGYFSAGGLALAELNSGPFLLEGAEPANLINNGQGVAPLVSTGGQIAVGDFVGDGADNDFAFSNFAGVTKVYAGNGNGSYSNVFSGNLGNQAYSLAVGDVNGDGKADIVFSYLMGSAETAGVSLSTSITSQAPAITSADSDSVIVPTGGTFDVTATGAPSPLFSLTGAEAGVTINPTTGVLTVGPTAADGVDNFTITAANGVGTPATQVFTLTLDQAPAITSTTGVSIFVPEGGTFDVTATGFPAPTFSLMGAEAGVSIDPASGVLTVASTAAAGTDELTVTAANGIAPPATQHLFLTLDQVAGITSADTASFALGVGGTFQVTATGFPAPTFGGGGFPPGVTINNTTGLLTVSPAVAGGQYTLDIAAANGVGPTVNQTFTLNVGLAPQIVSPSLATFFAGVGGTFQVSSTGVPAPTFALAALPPGSSVPSGVSINPSTGLLTVAPGTLAGQTVLQITATNGLGHDAQNFTLTINGAPTLGAATGPSATGPASATFTASNGVLPGTSGFVKINVAGFPSVSFVEIGFLDGLGYTAGNGAITISGTPNANSGGVYPISLKAFNAIGSTNEVFNITVDQPASITSSSGATFVAGAHGSFTVTTGAGDFPTPDMLSETGALPAGVTFTDNDNGTGTLSGTPVSGTGGSYSIQIIASNGIDGPAVQNFTLNVVQPPTITSPNNATFGYGFFNNFTVTTSGFPIPSLTLSNPTAHPLPIGVTFVDNGNGTASFFGTPPVGASGTYSFVIIASNGLGNPSVQSFKLYVAKEKQVSIALSPPSDYTTGVPTAPVSTVVTDVNGDGISDIVTLSYNGDVSIFLGNGDGTFQPSMSVNDQLGTGALNPQDLVAANINGQEVILAANNFTSDISLIVDNGGVWQFSGMITDLNDGSPIEAMTLDNVGGIQSLITANLDGSVAVAEVNPGPFGNGFSFYQGITIPNVIQTSSSTPVPLNSIALGNFILGDDGSDLVATGTNGNAAIIPGFVAPEQTSFGDFSGFGSPAPIAAVTHAAGVYNSLPSFGPNLLVLNRDGSVTTLLGDRGSDPSTAFVTGPTVNTGMGTGARLATGDFNGDGNPDFVALSPTNGFSLFTGNGAGVYSSAGVFGTSPSADSIAAADVNGDGKSDIIIAYNKAGPIAPSFVGVRLSPIVPAPIAPVFTNGSTDTAKVGTSFDFTFTTTSFPLPSIGEFGRLPGGLTFHDNGDGTATISGIPTAAAQSTFPLTLTAVNSVGTATQIFTLNLVQAPTINSVSSLTAKEGSSLAFTVTTTGGFPTPSLTEVGTLPDGVVFSDNGNGTALLDGEPIGTGVYDLTFTASNLVGSATQDFVLTVDPAVTFTGGTTANFTVGVSTGTFKVTTTGGPPNAALTVVNAMNVTTGVNTTLAALGFTFTDNMNGTGTLTGTPITGAGGVYDLTIAASVGPVTYEENITVTIQSRPQFVITPVNTLFTVGTARSLRVDASGGGTVIPTPTVYLASGPLPAGLTLTNNGDGTATISGTPAAGTGGAYPITLNAKNSLGTAINGPYAITLHVAQEPVITSANNTTFTVGKSYQSFAITTTGNSGFGVPSFSTAADSSNGIVNAVLPAGVTLKDNGNGTATLTGTPAPGTGGIYHFGLETASDAAGNLFAVPAVQNFTLTVDEQPTFQSGTASVTVEVGNQLGLIIPTITGFGTPSLRLAMGSLPSGLTFVDNGNGTASIIGTANTPGVFNLEIVATNATGNATLNFRLNVDQAPALSPSSSLSLLNLSLPHGKAVNLSYGLTGFPAPIGLVSGSVTGLPPGLTLSTGSTGTALILKGTPLATGQFLVSFTLATADFNYNTSYVAQLTIT